MKKEIRYSSLTNNIIDKLKGTRSFFERAKFFHREVDSALKSVIENNFVADKITCKKGCTHCCYTQVSVTQDEAEMLAEKIIKKSADVDNEVKSIGSILSDGFDITKLYLQAQSLNSAEKWYRLEFDKRRCVFLNAENFCSVYEDRPAVCRTNYVLSDSQKCSTEDGIEHPVRLVSTTDADMVIVGGFVASVENGALPFMLWKAIKKLKK